MAIKIQSRKAKARNHQKTVAKKITTNFKELEEDDVKSCSMGAGGEDLVMSPAARRVFPVSIECKATVGMPGPAAFKQAKANAPEGMIPIVSWKAKGVGLDKCGPAFETWEDLFKLIEFYRNMKSG